MKKTVWLFLVLAVVIGFFIGIYLYNVEENEEELENDIENIENSNVLCPFLLHASAASHPACPAPITATSYSPAK